MYAKHQYKKESEYESAWYIYTYNLKDYKVITERDILVHVHYITAKYRSKNYNLYSKKVLTGWEKIPELAGRFKNRRSWD